MSKHTAGQRPWSAYRPTFRPASLTLLVAAFLVVTDNNAFWQTLVGANGVIRDSDPILLVTIAGLLMGEFTLLLALLSWRHLLKPAFILVVLVASCAAYFMDTYGVVIDDGMLRNVLQTDIREAGGLWNPDMLVHIGLTGVLPAMLLAWVRVRPLPALRGMAERAALVVFALLLTFGGAASQYKEIVLIGRNHSELRYLINPTYPLYSAVELGAAKADDDSGPLQPLGRDATQKHGDRRKAVLVIVVGETARASNFALNGYQRPTNPQLAKADIVNFENFHSCGTATATSLPCMFSRQQRARYDPESAAHTENLLDVLKHAGLDVLWRDNNSGCKGVCARVESQDMTDVQVPAYCGTGECFDEVLLHQLGRQLRESSRDSVIVLHQHGSHGPDFYRRHPDRFTRFTPECASNAPQDCTRAAIINAYDNTILYTDYFLGRVIRFLRRKSKDFDTAMIYVSDHGESLGENGIYLHGFPYAIAPEEQTHVPFLVWFSPGFKRDFNLDEACLRQHAEERYSHDNLFSSVLGLMQIRTTAYRPENDLFRACQH